MKPEDHCPGCMHIHRGDDPCPYCGTLRREIPRSALYLPCGTVLEGRYFLGLPLWNCFFQIAYIGWDSQREERCVLLEYHPQNLVCRVPERKLVVPLTTDRAEDFARGVELFRRESEKMASLEPSENHVEDWDYFEFGGTPWRVIAYLEGQTLGAFLESLDTPLSWERAYAMLTPGAEILEAAAGSLPASPGPSSFWVRQQDRGLILNDFGMVRRRRNENTQRFVPALWEGYSPFEFYRGQQPSRESQVFLLGSLLFRLTTGSFLPEPPQWVDWHMALPQGLREEIPEKLQKVMSRALAFRRENRYARVGDFWSALGRALDTENPLEGGALPLEEERISAAAFSEAGEDGYVLHSRGTEALSEEPLPRDASEDVPEPDLSGEPEPEEKPSSEDAALFGEPEEQEEPPREEEVLFPRGESPDIREEEILFGDAPEERAHWMIPLSLSLILLVFLGGVGLILFKEEKVQQLIQQIRGVTAEQVDPVLLNERGGDFYYGRNGVSRDYGQAVALYGQAAGLGYPASQFNYGVLLYFGRGVSEDKNEGVQWIRRAAKQDLFQAEEFLEKREIPLEAPPESPDEKPEEKSSGITGIFRRPTKAPTPTVTPVPTPAATPTPGPTPTPSPGDVVAQGRKLLEAEQYREARELMEKAYERGSGEAAFWIGKMYVEGKGVETSLGKAALWYKRGAQREHEASRAMLYYLNPRKFAQYKDIYEKLYGSPAPTATPTPAPTATPTPAPTATPTPAPTATPTPAPTATPTPAPTATPTPAPTATPTPAPTATPTPAPTATPTPAPTATPTPAPTATPTPAPTATPTPAPTATPTPAPTATPTPAPTAAPTLAPTATPTPAPTAAPTLAPTATPTPAPAATPTPAPTATPTPAPTATPTPEPTAVPTPLLGGVSETVLTPREEYLLGEQLVREGRPEEAREHFAKAAADGHREARYVLGMQLLTSSRSSEVARGVQFIRLAAVQGNRNAQYELARSYAQGRGVPKDPELAEKWYRQAADNGSSRAQYYFAQKYYEGRGTTANYDTAALWMGRAAEGGYAPAQKRYGDMHARGHGVSWNEKEAARWYAEGAEQNYPQALHALGKCYLEGKGVPEDASRGASLMRRAGALGYAPSLDVLGTLYGEGRGVDRDAERSFRYFREAGEEKNYPQAQYHLGKAYEEGLGVEKDGTKALEWYQRSAAGGYAPAQYSLGIFAFYGRNMEANRLEAEKWMRKASGQGHDKAREFLQTYY